MIICVRQKDVRHESPAFHRHSGCSEESRHMPKVETLPVYTDKRETVRHQTLDIRCQSLALHRHSERSEESRYMPKVKALPVHTDKRETIRHSDVRRSAVISRRAKRSREISFLNSTETVCHP